MTVNTIETLIELIEECQGTGTLIDSVWEYTNSMNKQVMFAVFIDSQYCDIYESPYVDNPLLIWSDGKFIGKYMPLNVQIK